MANLAGIGGSMNSEDADGEPVAGSSIVPVMARGQAFLAEGVEPLRPSGHTEQVGIEAGRTVSVHGIEW
jgi:hypothetical protein